MRRTIWPVTGFALLVVGVALFLVTPRGATYFTLTSGEHPLPDTLFWLPWYRLLGLGVFLGGLFVLTATVAHRAGERKGSSATS